MPTAKKNNKKPESNQNPNDVHAPPLYTADAGEKAAEALAAEIDAVEHQERVTTKVDVEAATYAALGVVGFATAPEVRARFAKLPKDEFSIADLDSLEATCFAMLYIMTEARAAGALEDDSRVPAPLVAEATEVKTRMKSLCEYHFADDPEIAPELDRLRPGSGHRDLCNDLIGYARIYKLRHDVVKGDPKYYRPDDAERAQALSGAIIQKLSAELTPKARVAYDRYTRAWTLLHQRYNRLRAAGLWLFQNDELVQDRFPSLFTAARESAGKSRRQTRKEADEPPSNAAGEGAGSPTKPA